MTTRRISFFFLKGNLKYWMLRPRCAGAISGGTKIFLDSSPLKLFQIQMTLSVDPVTSWFSWLISRASTSLWWEHLHFFETKKLRPWDSCGLEMKATFPSQQLAAIQNFVYELKNFIWAISVSI